jgi:hypothetical protein
MYALDPISVGDIVLNAYSPAVSGKVVQRLNHEYVRVLWDDLSYATTHRDLSLRVIHRTSGRKG